MSNSQRIPSERTALPSWLTPFFEDFEREAIRFTPDSEAQQVLLKYLRILSRPLTTPGLRYVVLNHIRELITVALVAADDGAAKANRLGVRQATRLEAIKADIFENLSSPELTQTIEMVGIEIRRHINEWVAELRLPAGDSEWG